MDQDSLPRKISAAFEDVQQKLDKMEKDNLENSKFLDESQFLDESEVNGSSHEDKKGPISSDSLKSTPSDILVQTPNLGFTP